MDSHKGSEGTRILSKKRRRKGRAAWRKRSSSPLKSLLKWVLKLSLLLASLAVLTLSLGYLYYSKDLPNFESLREFRPPQLSRIYAADGSLLSEIYTQRRWVIPEEEIPQLVKNAVLSAEDADFYKHEGLDYFGMMRALYNSLKAGRLTGSGSTITQQTVKNILLSHEKSLSRKIKEFILARRLERQLSKDEILNIYLNTIYWGHGRYGLHEASRFYFLKKPKELELHEAALLAGVIQSPERHSPEKHPEAARRRRSYVLKQMLKNGYIDAAKQVKAEEQRVGPIEHPKEGLPEAGYFVEAVRRELIKSLGEERFLEGGLEIYTTLDPRRQRAALKALRGGLKALDKRRGFHKPKGKVSKKGLKAWLKKRKKALKRAPPVPGDSVPARLKNLGERYALFQLGVGEARVRRAAFERFPDLPEVGEIYNLKIRGDGPKHPKPMNAVLADLPQAALVVIDPQSHEIKALVGGWDQRDYPFNRAIQAKRQPGSAFKPFVWGAALESRKFSPATLMLDAPEVWRLRKGEWWKPKNYSRKFRGPISLRTALAHSVNSVSVKLCHEVGIQKVHHFAQRAGISAELADNLTVALGSSELSPLMLGNAYATIAAGGLSRPPQMISKIKGLSAPLPDSLRVKIEAEPKQTLEPEMNWLLRDVMRSVITEGSGRRLKNFPRPVVGKTGTSNQAKDAWFVGLLPDVVAVAWVGFDDPKPLGGKEAGGRSALPLVGAYLKDQERTGQSWPKAPMGVWRRSIDPRTGLLAPPGSKNAKKEYFLAGTVPQEISRAQGEVDADNFFREELAIPRLPKDLPKGPSLQVPAIGTAALPSSLGPDPSGPRRRVRAQPAPRIRALPAPTEEEEFEEGGKRRVEIPSTIRVVDEPYDDEDLPE